MTMRSELALFHLQSALISSGMLNRSIRGICLWYILDILSSFTVPFLHIMCRVSLSHGTVHEAFTPAYAGVGGVT